MRGGFLKIIGITGTNGKSSTAQFIYDMLKGMGRKVGIIGTLGILYDDMFFDVGLTTPPLETIKYHMGYMEKSGVEYLVLEVSSHALVQNRVKGLEFDVGVFTNLTRDHLDYHKTFENYKAAKRKILDMSKSMVFNADDPVGEEFFHDYAKKNLPFANISAICTCTDISAENIELSPNGTDFLMNFFETKTHVHVPVIGRFTVYNVMSAMAVLHMLGFGFDEIIDAVTEIKPVRGRAQILNLKTEYTIMIDFAHTPDALMNILTTVREIHDGRIITLFGCGGERDRTKRPLMAEIVSRYSDFIYFTSDNPRNEDPLQIVMDVLPALCEGGKPYRIILDREEAIVKAVNMLLPGDLLLLAGKGHECYQILGDVKFPFNEEKIVKKALNF